LVKKKSFWGFTTRKNPPSTFGKIHAEKKEAPLTTPNRLEKDTKGGKHITDGEFLGTQASRGKPIFSFSQAGSLDGEKSCRLGNKTLSAAAGAKEGGRLREKKNKKSKRVRNYRPNLRSLEKAGEPGGHEVPGNRRP